MSIKRKKENLNLSDSTVEQAERLGDVTPDEMHVGTHVYYARPWLIQTALTHCVCVPRYDGVDSNGQPVDGAYIYGSPPAACV